jgi:hypothetical protein
MPFATETSPPLLPELLTSRQVAQLLNICVRLVWKLAKQDLLKPIHVASCARWRRQDVLAYIDRLSTPQTAEGVKHE